MRIVTMGLLSYVVISNQLAYSSIGSTIVRRDRGKPFPNFFTLGPTMYWSPQLLGRSFQKARNFTASVTRMQDLVSKFSKNFPGVIPPDPHNGREATASRTQHPARPLTGRGRKRPGVGLGSPQLFSRICAPVLWQCE